MESRTPEPVNATSNVSSDHQQSLILLAQAETGQESTSDSSVNETVSSSSPAPNTSAGGEPMIAEVPAAGERVSLWVAPGAQVRLEDTLFDPRVARYDVDGDDLVVTLSNGGVLILDDFFASQDQPSELALLGGNFIKANALLETAQYAPQSPVVESDAQTDDDDPVPVVVKHGGGADFEPYNPGQIGSGPDDLGPLDPTALPLGAAFASLDLGDLDDELEALAGLGDDNGSGGIGDGAGPGGGTGGGDGGTGGGDGGTGGGDGGTGGGDGGDGSDGGDGGGPGTPTITASPVITLRPGATFVIDDQESDFVPTSTPELPTIGGVVPDGEINGVDLGNLTIDDIARSIEVEFVSDTSRSVDSLLIHDIAPNGDIINVRSIFTEPGSAEFPAGSRAGEDRIEAGTQLGLVLVNDGGRAFPDLIGGDGRLELRNASGGPANIADETSPILVHIAPNGNETVIDLRLYFTADDTPETPNENGLNPDGVGHVVSGVDPEKGLLIAFEDGEKPLDPDPFDIGRDNDFDDGVFAVRFGTATKKVVVPIDFAGGLDASISDEDSTDLGFARVRLQNGLDGDELSIDESVLAGTGIFISAQTDEQISFKGVASIEQYEKVISAVELQIDPETGGPGTRVLGARVFDVDGNGSNNAKITIRVEEPTPDIADGGGGFASVASEAVSAATHSGTDSKDRLRGSNDDDVIFGLGGNDNIRGRAGDDTIVGGPGTDTIRGGRGADRIVQDSLDDGRDRVIRFNPAEGDTLDISALLRDSGFGAPGTGVSDFIKINFDDRDGKPETMDARIKVDVDGPSGPKGFATAFDLIDVRNVANDTDIMNAITTSVEGAVA